MARKLPVFQVIAGAFALPWVRREAFVRALALPALAIFAMEIGWWLISDRIDDMLNWAVYVAEGLAWILFAIGCHRVVLLETRARDVPLVPGWGRRETFFLAWMIAVVAVILAIVWIVLTIAATVAATMVATPIISAAASWSGLVIGTYLFARFALVFPATAIDRRTSLKQAWRQTRGNGWRMAVIVGLMPWAFGYAARMAAGDEPGVVTAIVVTVLTTALLAVEISALSLSYRELAAQP